MLRSVKILDKVGAFVCIFVAETEKKDCLTKKHRAMYDNINKAIRFWIATPVEVRGALGLALMGKVPEEFYDGEWRMFLGLLRLPVETIYNVAKSRGARLDDETYRAFEEWISALSESGVTVNISDVGMNMTDCPDIDARVIATAAKWLDAYLNG